MGRTSIHLAPGRTMQNVMRKDPTPTWALAVPLALNVACGGAGDNVGELRRGRRGRPVANAKHGKEIAG